MSDSPPLLPRAIHIEEFQPLLGKTFLADCDPKPAVLTLIDVRPGRQTPGIPRQAFRLLFRSGPEALLVTGMYTMKSDGFGPDIIYIERTQPPAGDGADGHYYQAVFN